MSTETRPVRGVVIAIRVVLTFWGVMLLTSSVLEAIAPGFVRSEPTEISRTAVLPGVILLGVLGISLIGPPGWIAARKLQTPTLVCLAISTIGLTFLAPGAVGVPFAWRQVALAAVAYGLPAALAAVLIFREFRARETF